MSHTLIMGLAGTRAHHLPLMGPGQGPAGCRGQSPHRQLCAWLTPSLPPFTRAAHVLRTHHPLRAGASLPAGGVGTGTHGEQVALRLSTSLTTLLSLPFQNEGDTKNCPHISPIVGHATA